MSQITREKFIDFSRKILQDGAKVCPCCLWEDLDFGTDDDHTEYWLECRRCHIKMTDHLFRRTYQNWNCRVLDDPRINEITHDIKCEWWNDELYTVETVTLEGVKRIE